MDDLKDPTKKVGAEAGQGASTPPAARPAPAKKDVDEAKLTAVVPSRSLDRLNAELADAVEEVTYHCGVPIVRVKPSRIVEVCGFLKDDPDCRMTFLANLCGVDMIGLGRPTPRFDVVYNLFSVETRERLTLKAAVAEDAEIASVTAVWRTADWHEREAFDMFGIRFAGHPDLRRILMPEEFDAHPLRKDFPLEGRDKDHGYWRQPEDEHRNTFR
jgi:NADH-quinone oxidoreductase subunit C